MRIPILSLLLVFACTVHGQVTKAPYAKPDKLKSLAGRTLVVELPEPNPKVIEKFSKKTAAARTTAYEASLASYREQIEPAVRKYWTYNENIEFKTTSEIVQLFEEKSTKYVALLKVVLPDGGGVAAYTFGMGVPALLLTSTDCATKVTKKGELRFMSADFYSYLVVTPNEDGQERYSEAGLKFSLIQAQKVLEWNTTTGRQKSGVFLQYVKDQTEKNCPKLASKKLLVDKDGLYKSVDRTEAMDSYGPNLELVDHTELESAYLNGDAEKAVLFSLPVGTMKASALVVEITYLAYMKVVVDPSTNEILSSIVPGMGKNIVEGLTKADLRQLNKCK